jgi:hypothetical protein
VAKPLDDDDDEIQLRNLLNINSGSGLSDHLVTAYEWH